VSKHTDQEPYKLVCDTKHEYWLERGDKEKEEQSCSEHGSKAEAEEELKRRISDLLKRGAVRVDSLTVELFRDVAVGDDGWIPDLSVYTFSIVKR
jgi:hypothetical protein